MLPAVIHQILFVGVYHERHRGELLFVEQLLQFMSRLLESLPVRRIDDVNQNVCVFKIVPPVWANFPLAANIPDVEFEAVRGDGLNVETLRWRDVRDVLGRQRLEDGRFARIV